MKSPHASGDRWEGEHGHTKACTLAPSAPVWMMSWESFGVRTAPYLARILSSMPIKPEHHMLEIAMERRGKSLPFDFHSGVRYGKYWRCVTTLWEGAMVVHATEQNPLTGGPEFAARVGHQALLLFLQRGNATLGTKTKRSQVGEYS